MVILVCGLSSEAPVALLIQSLRKRRADFLVIDQKTATDRVQLRWQVSDGGLEGYIRVGSRVVDVHGISSVYHRFFNPEDVCGSNVSRQGLNKARSVLRALVELFDVLPGRVVNRRRPMMSNNSKPYQLLLIRQSGFAIPATLITNNIECLKDFAYSQRFLVYKSISSVRSVVDSFDEESFGKISLLRYLPTQFQRRIIGLNVRVHVIGRRAIATQIQTPAVDYRFAVLEGEEVKLRPYELSLELRNRCLRLARLCNLAFAGIDLIISDDGVYCLEVNPSPGYCYYQEATGQGISDVLADYLINK